MNVNIMNICFVYFEVAWSPRLKIASILITVVPSNVPWTEEFPRRLYITRAEPLLVAVIVGYVNPSVLDIEAVDDSIV